MAKKKLQKSETQIQYEKQLKRIKQFVRRAEKRGYYFPEDIIPQKLKRPTKKSVEKLARLTPESLYKKSQYVIKETGELISGVEGRKAERKEVAKKAKESRKYNVEAQKQLIQVNLERGGYNRAKENVFTLLKTIESGAKNRGYIFPKEYIDNIREYVAQIDDEIQKLNVNNQVAYDKIHEAISQLESITEESILSSEGVIFKDPRTGTAFKGHEGLKIEAYREEQQREHELSYDTEVSETDNVLNVIRGYIDNWFPSSLWTDWFANTKEKDKNLLERILGSAIALVGEEAVAQRLQENADEVLEIAYGVIYDSGGKEGRGGINADLVRFTAIIMDRPLTQHESEVITQASEANELE